MSTQQLSTVESRPSLVWHWARSAAIVAATLVGGPAWAQNLLQNPSFEAPVLPAGTFAGFAPGATIGQGWRVDSATVASVVVLTDGYVGGGAVWPQGSEGSQYLFLGDSQGLFSVSQDVTLREGVLYRLDYDIATLGAAQGPFGGAANLEVVFRRVSSGIVAASQNSFVPFDGSSGQFHARGFEFVCPASGTYRLSLSNGTAGYFTCVDRFSLQELGRSVIAIGTLGGNRSSDASISANGEVVSGYSTTPNEAQGRAFRWRDNAIEDIGGLGNTYAAAYAVNADGSVIVGDSERPGVIGRAHAFRWSAATGAVDLGSGADRSVAFGVNADGSVATGYEAFGTNYRAFRWTAQTGIVNIGTLGGVSTVAYAVSADGNVITGSSSLSGEAGVHAFRWTSAAGMQDIGSLGGYAYGLGISADGTRIVGFSQLPGGAISVPFTWDAVNGMQALGTPPGSTFGAARAVSPDGAFIVGDVQDASGTYRAMVWTSDGRARTLADFLAENSVQAAGWTFERATGLSVSVNGLTIVGEGRHAGQLRAFRASFCDNIMITEYPPYEVSVCRGSAATVRVVVANPTPISYQWFRNGEPIPGATSSTYTTPNVGDADDGDILLCRITNGCITQWVVSIIYLSGSIRTQPITPNLEYGPAEVTYSVEMNGDANYQYHWRVGTGTPGGWVPLEDGRAFDGLDYSGTRTSTLRVTRGAGWRFRTISCVVTTPCGEQVSTSSAELRYPFLIVTGGHLQGSGRVEGYADFPTEQLPYVYQTNDSDTIPPFPGISFVRSGGGQTGGGFVGGAFSPTINFSFASQLDNDANGGTLSISMGFSISGNGYGDCGGQPYSGVTMDGVPYTVRWTLCAPSVSGQIFYRNTLTGESGVLSQFGSGSRSISVSGPPPLCPADINFDGTLDPDDLSDFIGCYFSSPPCGFADYNGDGLTDPDDLSDYIGAFFGGC